MSQNTLTISGRVIDRAKQKGVPALRVEAQHDDSVASAVTDERGAFKIVFDQSHHPNLFKDQSPDVIFTFNVFDRDTLIKTTQEAVPRDTKGGPFELDIVLTLPVDNAEFVVRGTVRNPDGTIPLDILVRAFDKDLRSEQLLGEMVIDGAGRYEIHYIADQFRRSDKGSADLIVRAYDANELQPSGSGGGGGATAADPLELAVSPIIFNAAAQQTVDLVIGNKAYVGLSEYEKLAAELTPLLDGLSLAELTESNAHRDISFLSGETGQDPARITLLVRAHRLLADTNVPAEVFYGMFREGLPGRLRALLTRDEEEQRDALERAVEANIIPGKFAGEIDRTIEQLKALLVREALKEPPAGQGSGSSFSDLLRLSLDDSALRERFLSAYVNHTGPPEEFWKALAAQPALAASIDGLQRTIQLGALTGNHLPLVSELKRMQQSNEFSNLQDLTRLDQQGWMEIIARRVGNNPIGAPPGVPGSDESARANNYARAMSHMVEDAFPTAYAARRLETGDLPGKQDLQVFLSSNPRFNLQTTQVDSYLRENPQAMAGVQNMEAATQSLKAMQRVYRVAPRYEQASALIKDGVTSAYSIARMGENVFVARYSDAFGSEAAAKRVYGRSQQAAAMALNLVMDGISSNKVSTNVAPDEAVVAVKGLPEWSTLFGSIEMCECEHCNSVYGPAAYLVDMLHFLRDRQSKVTGKTAKDILFLRRPDIGEIELTCENTNTPVPYVDLVNEALENAVLPSDSFLDKDTAQEARLEAALNSRTLTSELKNAFNPKLSNEAVITIGDGRPEWWITDEPGFTYAIRKESNRLKVLSRSLQTRGSRTERAANPQYTNTNVYDTVLKNAVYPWSMPFDLWAEEAHAYLTHLCVPRSQIIESFQPGGRADILSNLALACEYLGLTSEQAKIITGVTSGKPVISGQTSTETSGLWNLWGFESQNLSSKHSIPDPSDRMRRLASGNWLNVLNGRVDVFLQQSGLSYKEMLELLGTYFVNPPGEGGRKIRIVAADPQSRDTCETDKLRLDGFDLAAAASAVRFTRLCRALGWSMRDLDRVIKALGATDLDELSVDQDVADSNNKFLIQLSHVQRLHSMLGVPILRLLSWWADIDSQEYIDHDAPGQPRAASLYDQLFRNRTVINPPDAAFKENPGDMAGSGETLTGHAAAITAALGISAADFALLLSDANVIPPHTQARDELTLGRLSQLHRHSSLARALGLPVRDYLTLLRLFGGKPFATTTDTVTFVENVQQAVATGFSVAELDCLLSQRSTTEAAIAPDDETVARVLNDLRAGLLKIAEENKVPKDDPAAVDLLGELTRRKLGLLNWDPTVVDEVIATLSGSIVYEVLLDPRNFNVTSFPNAADVYRQPLGKSSAKFEIPANLSGIVEITTADPQRPELIAHGFLNPAERKLLRAAASDFQDDGLIKAVEGLIREQDELQGEISYDTDRKALRFAGPMTNARKARLDKVSTEDAYTKVVKKLFDAPRQFVGRAMRTFAVHDYSTKLTALPKSVSFPDALNRKAYFDATTESLHFVGVMRDEERDALLKLSTDTNAPEHSPYGHAVSDLYQQPETAKVDASDFFLDNGSHSNDVAALFDEWIDPASRILLVLQKLLPYLRRTLGEQLAAQKMAEALQVETRVADALLRGCLISHVSIGSANAKVPVMEELLDKSFIESSPNLKITAAGFPAQFRSFVLLHKASLLASRFKLTHRQLGWLFAYGKTASWLDISTLPVDAQGPAATIDGLLRLAEFGRLRDGLKQGETALDDLLNRASVVTASSAEADKNKAKQAWVEAVTHWTQWPRADLEALLGAAGDHTKKGALGVSFPEGYTGEHLLVRLMEVFGLLERLGISAAQAIVLASGDVTLEAARGVRQAARAKYDEAQWLNLAKPLCDVLREKQRAALVAHLIAHLKLPLTTLETPHPNLARNANVPAVRELQQKLNAAGANPPLDVDGKFGDKTEAAVKAFQQANQITAGGVGQVKSETWKALDEVGIAVGDAGDLYSYLLIDVEMDACMMTSRIKQAISSVQLFAQRCLMNLEPDVAANAQVDAKWREWKWMKHYRVWEANRKVFLYAENWIEPELRDDKSPFFAELEGELLQGDLTLNAAEDAFMHYLEKLDQTANLEVVGVHHQLDETVDILHVFARTPGIPHIYFYRQQVDSTDWTAWERIDLDIEGEHLIPVMWSGRLHLFWPIFIEKAEPMNVSFTGGTLKDGTPRKYWEIKLAWSQRKSGSWTNKQVSSQAMALNFTANIVDADLSRFFFRTAIDEQNRLYIGLLFPFVIDILKKSGGKVRSFRVDDCNGEPVVDFEWGVIPESVAGTSYDRMFYRESNQDALSLPGSTNKTPTLWETPGTFRLLPHADGSSIAAQPFFYRDDQRTFFVIPSDPPMSIALLSDQSKAHAGLTLEYPRRYWSEAAPLGINIGPAVDPRDPPIFTRLIASPPLIGRTGAGTAGAFVPGRLAGSVSEALPQQTALMKIAGGLASARGAEPISALMMIPIRDGEPTPDGDDLPDTDPPGSSDPGGVLAPPSTGGTGSANAPVNVRYKFQTFYHPWLRSFVREFNRNGVDGLLQRSVQTQPASFAPPGIKALDFKTDYKPGGIVLERYPEEVVDFEDGPYALYNWELFFHAPLLIADRLSKNQRYEEAQQWFHYIFDPTDTSAFEVPRRYWHTKPFFDRTRDGYQKERIQNILKLLAKGANAETAATLSADELEDLGRFKSSIDRWRKDPFKPHLIARTRTTAYQKTVVMKYLDNLIAWADQLFRRDTIESINEAAQLYILAAEILGRRPQEIPPRATPSVQSYNTIERKLDAFSGALIEIEKFISPSANGNTIVGQQSSLSMAGMLFFCVPKNDKLLAYWDTIADRLFKIRHCMNIEGVVRQLPLFEPPIEPGLLVKAAAAGVDLNTALNDVSAATPYYRFNVMSQKASELCAELKGLGQAMLAAIEKRDGERLSLLRAGHETALLALAEEVRKLQRDEAARNIEALIKSRETAVARWIHYQKLLGVQDPKVPEIGATIPEVQPSELVNITQEDGIRMTSYEEEESEKLGQANALQLVAGIHEILAGVAHGVPNFNVEPWGVGATFGGSNVGSALSSVASHFRTGATQLGYEASRSARLGQYVMRAHDWTLQSNLAAHEIMQIDRQGLAADLRKQIAERELSNHRTQLANSRAMEDFLRDKYTNQELYGWMVGQVATVYFQTYQLAYDLAKRAERAYRHELAVEDSSFIQFGYWDSLKKGLLAGERLYHDIKRMEVAYLEHNNREHEITKHISLLQLDPAALIQLRQTGECVLSVPEAVFDLDFPGHYMRRIRSASLSIPCVTGPYTGVHCTLSLINSSVRHASTLLNNKHARQQGDPRFTDILGTIQSIVTSSGQNDSGLFESNLHDERYLPFEGAGAISEWQLELPEALRQFDYHTISDVILHLRYMARDGGTNLKRQAALEFQTAINTLTGSESGLALFFSLRHDFPTEWSAFVNGQGKFTAIIRRDHFPYFTEGNVITINAFELYAAGVTKNQGIGEPATATAALSAQRQFTFSAPTDVLTRTTDGQVFLIVRYTLALRP